MQVALSSNTPTMTSREIAELTGKQHAHVMRDVRTMLEALEKDVSSFGSIFKDSYGRTQQEYKLDRELTLTLVSGYDIPLRHRVVTKLSELESGAVIPVSPIQQAATFMKASLEIAALFSIPEHIAQVEVVKQTKLQIGFDASPYLRLAPAQNDVPSEEMRLEPTELGKMFGLSAVKLNRLLESAGLQRKVSLGWEATGEGKLYSSVHQWVSGAKSGYNLKWSVSRVRNLIAAQEMLSHS